MCSSVGSVGHMPIPVVDSADVSSSGIGSVNKILIVSAAVFGAASCGFFLGALFGANVLAIPSLVCALMAIAFLAALVPMGSRHHVIRTSPKVVFVAGQSSPRKSNWWINPSVGLWGGSRWGSVANSTRLPNSHAGVAFAHERRGGSTSRDTQRSSGIDRPVTPVDSRDGQRLGGRDDIHRPVPSHGRGGSIGINPRK